jgi:hypothetical protein
MELHPTSTEANASHNPDAANAASANPVMQMYRVNIRGKEWGLITITVVGLTEEMAKNEAMAVADRLQWFSERYYAAEVEYLGARTLEARFQLGKIYVTPGASDAISDEERIDALRRHVRGDWGEVCDEDKAENDFAIDKYLRVLSAYTTTSGVRFWIITEADRSVTTILLPDEY